MAGVEQATDFFIRVNVGGGSTRSLGEKGGGRDFRPGIFDAAILGKKAHGRKPLRPGCGLTGRREAGPVKRQLCGNVVGFVRFEKGHKTL